MIMSSGSNQRTLFQTWGTAVSQNKVVKPKKDVKKAAGRPRTAPSNTARIATTHPPQNPLWTEIGQGSTYTLENPVRTEDPIPEYEDGDDDDDLMVVAVCEAEKSLELDGANFFRDGNFVEKESKSLSPTPSGGQTYPDFPGFDSSSAKVWVYPTNYPIREYQLKISEAALFQNTLVCLPTGLGKTFIASVVMYNFYRWYPSGKIVFMAPTKPLVAQQIEACYKVMGIPQAHMAELTGKKIMPQKSCAKFCFIHYLQDCIYSQVAQQQSRGRRCGSPSVSSSSHLRSWWMICQETPARLSRSSVWWSMKPTRRWATMPTVRYRKLPLHSSAIDITYILFTEQIFRML